MSLANHRKHPRLRLPVGYAAVCVKRGGQELYGHAYDLSLGGVRFELDTPLEPGEHVEIDLALPGRVVRTVHARGKCVRFHDEDEVGPIRMGVSFDALSSDGDRMTLERYLASHHAIAA